MRRESVEWWPDALREGHLVDPKTDSAVVLLHPFSCRR